MRRHIRLLTTLLVLQSCCPKLYPSSTEVIERTEVVKEVVRDTVIQVQPDSSMLQALIQCDSKSQPVFSNPSKWNQSHYPINRQPSQSKQLWTQWGSTSSTKTDSKNPQKSVRSKPSSRKKSISCTGGRNY